MIPLFASAGLQIDSLLKTTLTRTFNEKYGLVESSQHEKNGLFAIPFKGPDSPKIGSEFSLPLTTLNYTVQSYMKKGFSARAVKYVLEPMLDRMERKFKTNDDATDEQQLIARWQKEIGGSLKAKRLSDWEAITIRLNALPLPLRLAFIHDFILPHMEYYHQTLSSNAQNLVDLTKKMKGFTGTLWNASTFHYALTPQEEVGVSSKTLLLLSRPINQDVKICEDQNPGHILAYLKDHHLSFDMICDAGGYFKDFSNLQTARALAKQSQKPTVFYHQGVKTLTDGEKETPFQSTSLQEDARVTFLDQINTTGANIAQHSLARSVVTISKDMLLRDLLQAVWRLRGLDKGQSIQWIISKDITQLIRAALLLEEHHPIRFPEILDYMIYNQAKQLGKDNFVAFQQMVQAVKQKILLDILLSDVSLEHKTSAIDLFKSSWIKEEMSYLTNGKLAYEEDKQEVIEKIIAEAVDFISRNCKKGERFEQAIEELNLIKRKFSADGILPEKLLMTGGMLKTQQ